jgi:flavin-dependent dehydrogenase
MNTKADVVIVGGGLAGLTCAIHLLKYGLKVQLIEKNKFPKHKVCGEYISNEVLPYLKWIGVDLNDLQPTKISKLQFSTVDGKIINSELPLGGFGISRFSLDGFLCKIAIEKGCEIVEDAVETITFQNNEFIVKTTSKTLFQSKNVIGAFGKRSNIDLELKRDFVLKKSPWLAVKAHYSGDFPDNLVGLHNFRGGYCGVSKVENNIVNICYLADYKTFKQYKNIEEYQEKVMFLNPFLREIFKNHSMLFEKPITISQISFEEKASVENHILMIGDTAGLIHPLCGNGMAMAIHSAKIASELVFDFHTHKIKDRRELEKKYIQQWNIYFKKRIRNGRFLAFILQQKKISVIIMSLLVVFPIVLPKIIKKTHGKPIVIPI